MDFTTKINIPQSDFLIDHTTKMMLLGSCFSENIGLRLKNHKFQVNMNPMGILFNPLSITSTIKRLLEENPFNESDLVTYNDLHHSFMHHGSFSKQNKEESLKNINYHYLKATDFLKTTDLLMITFGTAYTFKLKSNGEIVSNCHKFPSEIFTRFRLTIDEIVEEWKHVIIKLLNLNSKIKILFTVSPIRHLRDGAHDNQLSKSILHLAVDKLQSIFPDAIMYFPSFEIMIDELRDYRFYEQDMIHPSSVASDWIWNNFSKTYFSKNTIKINKEWSSIKRSLEHRPLHPNTAVHREFLEHTYQNLISFAEKYPMINSEEEISNIKSLI